ncbi:hypothetical protein ACQPZF_07155 [Actinosynnema sp. CS-041913]|uniref:hypothetical protein n=1 Tax=Actinosynnema sp. CS-041913 TaxID=3239917 RepID=UPI003D90E31C
MMIGYSAGAKRSTLLNDLLVDSNVDDVGDTIWDNGELEQSGPCRIMPRPHELCDHIAARISQGCKHIRFSYEPTVYPLRWNTPVAYGRCHEEHSSLFHL